MADVRCQSARPSRAGGRARASMWHGLPTHGVAVRGDIARRAIQARAERSSFIEQFRRCALVAAVETASARVSDPCHVDISKSEGYFDIKRIDAALVLPR